MTHPILFIHGFGGGVHEYEPIIDFLNQSGHVKCYRFSYAQNIGQVSLESIADQLHEFIVANVVEDDINIVALSQGGVIARAYIAKYDDKKIRKCITICTPHHGSLLAYCSSRPGIKELRPSSDFLKNLDHKKTNYYAIYNPLDLMVFPGWSGYFEDAKENIRVWALVHPLTFTHSKTLRYIRETLSRGWGEA